MIAACLLTEDAEGNSVVEKRLLGTMTRELHQLAQWLCAAQSQNCVMLLFRALSGQLGVVGCEDHDGVVLDAELFKRVEDLPDVVVAFHQLVAIVSDPRLTLELLGRKVGRVPHRKGQVKKERFTSRLLAFHEVDRFRNQLVVDFGPDFLCEWFHSTQWAASRCLKNLRPLAQQRSQEVQGRQGA
jgi:hypothetical protein